MLDNGEINDKEHELMMFQSVAANVGTALAGTFKSHFKYLGKLPKPEQVLTGQKYTVGTDEISAMYSFVISLCYSFRDSVAQGLSKEERDTYSTNMFDFILNHVKNPEISIMSLRLALKKFQLPVNPRNEGYKRLIEQYGKLIN
jgi:hypothetical protein